VARRENEGEMNAMEFIYTVTASTLTPSLCLPILHYFASSNERRVGTGREGKIKGMIGYPF
jgi:hypothetical protein